MTIAGALRNRTPAAKKLTGAALIAACCMLLAACVLMPGKFTSSLDLRKDGQFSFAYKGEIHFVSASDLDDKKGSGSGAVFQPQPCETASGEPRKCSTAEINKQMRDWEEQQKQAGAAQAEQMSAMMGGVDLSDPKAAQEFARKLARQHGWRSVKSMGKGRFDVDFAISGKLTHDFTFPVMEEYPLANPFVQVMLRQDGTARIVAPGFSNGAAGSSPLRALAQIGAMDEANKDKAKGPKLPRIDGTFAITTDGAIMANNTDEGPSATTSGSRLNWIVNDRTDSPPAALINLAR
jgi:hypothetical protein